MTLPDMRGLALLVLLGSVAVAGAEDGWPDSDPVADSASVNEGELTFLGAAPAVRRVLRTRNYLTITPDSLAGGWVMLEQCQSDLDPVPALEIVYRYHGMRDLRVTSSAGVAAAVVTGDTVQLTGIRPGGEVCIAAGVQVLLPDGAGGYRLQSGPFHRRFLDGYYPLRLDYRVEWPAGLLLKSVTPAPQPGFAVSSGSDFLQIDTLFEGMLIIELRFAAGTE